MEQGGELRETESNSYDEDEKEVIRRRIANRRGRRMERRRRLRRK